MPVAPSRITGNDPQLVTSQVGQCGVRIYDPPTTLLFALAPCILAGAVRELPIKGLPSETARQQDTGSHEPPLIRIS